MTVGKSNLTSLSGETWEYFPASNAFKSFALAPNGERYYFTNGWYKRVAYSQELWYRFDNNGIMQKGFVEEGGNVYYLNNSINELAYMVTGYKDFEGTGYTGYFRKDGALVALFPTSARVAYETNLVALPNQPSFDRLIYEMIKSNDRSRDIILKTEKAYGQSAMGNFVGYWYYMASGQKKFRFETINTELQIARFATNGWINIYDTDKKLYSYRFDSASNVLANITTPEGVSLDASGHIAGRNVLLDFATLDVTKKSAYELAMTTHTTLPVNTKKLQSHLVGSDGMPMPESAATDIWTVINLQGMIPILTNTVHGGTSDVQQLYFLSNTIYAGVGVDALLQPPAINTESVINNISAAKITQVLSNVNFTEGVKAVGDVANYGLCMGLYTVREMFVV